MKNPFLLTESESNEFNAKGGMSTKELIARLDPIKVLKRNAYGFRVLER